MVTVLDEPWNSLEENFENDFENWDAMRRGTLDDLVQQGKGTSMTKCLMSLPILSQAANVPNTFIRNMTARQGLVDHAVNGASDLFRRRIG